MFEDSDKFKRNTSKKFKHFLRKYGKKFKHLFYFKIKNRLWTIPLNTRFFTVYCSQHDSRRHNDSFAGAQGNLYSRLYVRHETRLRSAKRVGEIRAVLLTIWNAYIASVFRMELSLGTQIYYFYGVRLNILCWKDANNGKEWCVWLY